jgi:hypothetical protein
MMLALQISVFLSLALSIVFGLFTALKAQREDLAYRQIFLWLISPLVITAGLIFVEKSRKRHYFRRVKSNLLIKNVSK